MQQELPDVGNLLLNVVELQAGLQGRLLPCFKVGEQGLAADLAVGRQRHGVHTHDVRRHHVPWQPLPKHGLELVMRYQQRTAIDEGQQQFHFAVDQQLDAHVPRGQQVGHLMDDLAHLDTLAADLDLAVPATKVDDVSIAVVAAIVARPVAAPAEHRKVDEALRSKFRPLVIALPNAVTGHDQLAHHAARAQALGVVQDIGARVLDWASDHDLRQG